LQAVQIHSANGVKLLEENNGKHDAFKKTLMPLSVINDHAMLMHAGSGAPPFLTSALSGGE
jgi:hypothetical protein